MPRFVLLTSFALAAGGLQACDREDDEAESKTKEAAEQPAAEEKAAAEEDAEEPIEPLPETVDDVDPAKVEIGRRLYFDPLLSADQTVSCASCHQFDQGGADGMVTSTGIDGQKGPINSPTSLNSRYNFVHFWDGRAEDLQHQAEGPVTNPVEMGAEWAEVVERVEKDEWYAEKFDAAYDEVTQKTITHALAEYEKTLVTPSPFDAYLRGDEGAISDRAKEGYALFKEVGCTTCHTGINVGGGSFQKMGLVKPYFADLERPLTDADLGRYNVTNKEEDKHKFKVPTLRNVELTAPYFHDGSRETLEEAVRDMADHQLGKDLDDQQVGKIVAFLKSLTGELPEQASPPEGFERALAKPPEAKEEHPFQKGSEAESRQMP